MGAKVQGLEYSRVAGQKCIYWVLVFLWERTSAGLDDLMPILGSDAKG